MASVRLSPSGQDLGIAAGSVAGAAVPGPVACPAAATTPVASASSTSGGSDANAQASATVRLAATVAGVVTAELLIAGVPVCSYSKAMIIGEEWICPLMGGAVNPPATPTTVALRVTTDATAVVNATNARIFAQTY
jgi:hypothetical protein